MRAYLPFCLLVQLVNARMNGINLATATKLSLPQQNGFPQSQLNWARIWDAGCSWADIHTGHNLFNWTVLDQLIITLKHNMPTNPGTEPVKINYVIGLTPDWVMASFSPVACGAGSANCPLAQGCCCQDVVGGMYCNQLPPNIIEYTNFISAFVYRYKGSIDALELWNEPQNVRYLFPYNSANAITLANMANTLKFEVDKFLTNIGITPVPLLIGPSCVPRNASVGMVGGMVGCQLLLDSMVQQNSYASIDFMSIHIYTWPGETATDAIAQFQAAVSFFQTYTGLPNPTKPWITSINIVDIDPSNNPVVDLNVGAAYISSFKALLSALLNQADVFVFWHGWDSLSAQHGGLLFDNGQKFGNWLIACVY